MKKTILMLMLTIISAVTFSQSASWPVPASRIFTSGIATALKAESNTVGKYVQVMYDGEPVRVSYCTRLDYISMVGMINQFGKLVQPDYIIKLKDESIYYDDEGLTDTKTLWLNVKLGYSKVDLYYGDEYYLYSITLSKEAYIIVVTKRK